METGYFVQLCVQTLWIIFILSLPTVIAASVVGIIISLGSGYNAVTGSNIAFLLKIIAVFATLALTYHWMGTTIINFSSIIFEMIPKVNG